MILRPYKDEAAIREMVKRQEDMKVPTELLPTCPHYGKPMTMNLRCDDTSVEDDGWQRRGMRVFSEPARGKKFSFWNWALAIIPRPSSNAPSGR